MIQATAGAATEVFTQLVRAVRRSLCRRMHIWMRAATSGSATGASKSGTRNARLRSLRILHRLNDVFTGEYLFRLISIGQKVASVTGSDGVLRRMVFDLSD